MLQPTMQQNDKKAKLLITVFSVIVFLGVTVLGKYNLAGKVSLPFDVHIFALINALTNSLVAVLLIAGLTAVAFASFNNKKKKVSTEQKMEKKECKRKCMLS